jgi:hypothetical protein
MLICGVVSSCAGSAPSAPPAPRAIALDPPPSFTPWQKLDWIQDQMRDANDAQRAELLVRAAELYFSIDRPEIAGARAREANYTRGGASPSASSVPSRAHAVLGAIALERYDLSTARRELTTAASAAHTEVDASVANALLALVEEKAQRWTDAAVIRTRVKVPNDPRVQGYLQALQSAGPDPAEKPQAAPLPTAPLTAIRIIPRSYWKPAKIGPDTDPMAPPKRITVHHEGKEFYGSTLEDSIRQMRNIQEYHQRGKKWADIGYHYVIDRLGNIFEGRPLTIQGAHAGERNKRGETPNQANIGISLLGNFDSQQITPAQEKALRQLVSYLETTYGIPNSEVYTHNEIRQKFNVGATGCPGKHLASVVVDIRRNGALAKPSAASSRAGN